ncbi:unnamed protein product [Rotaria sp. Silwood2]|nr:unnamed protein product [Rotaria sp. Silwood2]
MYSCRLPANTNVGTITSLSSGDTISNVIDSNIDTTTMLTDDNNYKCKQRISQYAYSDSDCLETKKLAGDHKNVVHDLIELQVEDPNVRDLTVVDLPVIAHNPVDDQLKDIHKQTTNLIRKFISQSDSVILCMFPGNVDFATVESLSLAREVDPSGIPMIGVITKSDLASNHDILVQQLLMEKCDVQKLTLGFVAVRNRSTDEKMTLEDARKREKEFFHQHPASTIAGWHCLGINVVINRLAGCIF